MDTPEKVCFTALSAAKIKERGESNSGGWGGTVDVYITSGGEPDEEVVFVRSDIVDCYREEVAKLRALIEMVLLRPRAEDEGYEKGEMFIIQIEVGALRMLRDALKPHNVKETNDGIPNGK